MSAPRSRSGGSVIAHDVEPVEQVLAERAVAHHRDQVAVRGGDDAHVHGHGRVAPTGVTMRSWSTRRILACMAQRHVADLVEEERAAVRLAEPARALVDRAGERALDVAEKLALQQFRRDGRAVDRDEGLARARAVAVQGAGDLLLARAGLSLHEHGRVARRGQADELVDLAHRRAGADELVVGQPRGGGFRARAARGRPSARSSTPRTRSRLMGLVR